MRHRLFAALVGTLALALPAAALAHIRLSGVFVMTGRITAAGGVPGEHVGETVARLWYFVAPCPAGQCRIEGLVRSRATGQDRVKLSHRFGVFNHWVGRGSFFAPLACGGRIYPRGERVFFKVTVRITGTTLVNGAPFASSVQARYASYRRTNRTRCVTVLRPDAAVYTGQAVTTAPGQSGSTRVPG